MVSSGHHWPDLGAAAFRFAQASSDDLSLVAIYPPGPSRRSGDYSEGRQAFDLYSGTITFLWPFLKEGGAAGAI